MLFPQYETLVPHSADFNVSVTSWKKSSPTATTTNKILPQSEAAAAFLPHPLVPHQHSHTSVLLSAGIMLVLLKIPRAWGWQSEEGLRNNSGN